MLEDEEESQLPEDKSISTNSNAEIKDNEDGTRHDNVFQCDPNKISNRSDRCEEESDDSSVTLSSNVNTDEELWVVLVGFPSSIRSDQVAECVSKATGARVNRVAPLNLDPASGSSLPSSWIAFLQSHNGEVDWSVQNEITVECCGQNCTVQCNPLTPKIIQSTKIDSPDKSDSKEVRFNLKAQDLQSQHLLIQRKPFENNTTDTQLVYAVDTPDDCDDNATLYFPDHKICYKSNWKWDEDKQELCVEAVHFEDTEDVLNENHMTADEFLHNTSQEEESPELCTVEVQGFEPQDAEQCHLYFENSVEGGREDIVHLSVCEDKMYITFKTSKAAEEISGRSHQFISGQHVQISRLTPLDPLYQNMILLKNVDEFTNKDHLSMFLENITGLEPQEILQGKQQGIVLVKFEQNIDFDKIKEPCETIMLHGRQLSVSQVTVSNCMLVESLAPGATEKDIFEFLKLCMPRDRTDRPCTAVERVEPMTDENKSVVFIKDGEVIKGIMFDGNTRNDVLLLTHYMKCPELGGDSGMFTTVTKPKSFILTHDDPYKMAYLQKLQTAQDELMIQLLPLHAQVKIVDSSVIVHCTLTSSLYMAHGLASTWTHYVQLTFSKYMKQLEVYKLKIIHAIWQEIETYVAEINKQTNGDAIFFMRLTKQIVIVVGKSSARGLFQALLKTVQDIEIRRKYQVTHETDKCFKRYQLQLLKTVNFHDIIKIHNNGISVNICPDVRGINFTGFPADVKMAQVETVRVLNLIKSNSMVDKSRTYRHVLSSNQTCELLAKKFIDGNVFAILDTSDDNIMIYAFGDKEIINARRCILETVVELVYSLNDVPIHLRSSEEWHDIIQSILFRNPGKLQIASFEQPHQFLLTGTIDIMDDVIKSIDDFIHENTIYSEEYCLSLSRQKFVTIQWRDKIKLIAASLTKYKVEILEEKEKDEGICIKGTETGLNLMMRKLQSLGQEIMCHVTMVDDPVRVKFFTEEESCKRLDLFERSSKCVVGFGDEPNVLKIVKSNRYDVVGDVCFIGDVKIISSVQLSEGVTIFLVQGELSQMVVDALVSEINDRMENFKELTRHVASKVSEGEIITSGPGQLSSKQIIYAVSIVYKDGKSGEDKRLFKTVFKCLQTADTSGFTSIALPALGSSTHSSSYPLSECTSVVVKTLKTYMETRSHSNIKAIYLRAHNSDCVKHFSIALQNVLPHNVPNDSKTRKRGNTQYRFEMLNVQTRKRALNYLIRSHLTQSQQQAINVTILDGDIADQPVDVIVNSTSCDLNLSNGALSASILAAGGSGLQDECRTEYPQGIPIGDIARTSGHNLCCKEVFHVVLCDFKNPNAAKILESLITNCLKEASQGQYSSLAFPALGCGILGYPYDVVSSTMIRAIDTFQKSTPSTTIKDVNVVIFQDKELVKVFQQECEKTCKQTAESANTSGRIFPYQHVLKPHSASIMKSIKNFGASSFWMGSFECLMYDLRLMIRQADITEENVDAIVNSTNDCLDLNIGAVSRVLKAKCGADLENECRRKVSDMQTNGICSTNAFNLKCKIILHVSSSRYHADLEGGVKAILKEADKLSIRSIAFPALGTGFHHITPEESAKAMFRALVSFCKGKRETLNEVRVILFDNSTVAPFVSAIQAHIAKLTSGKRGIGKLLKGKTERTTPEVVTMVNSLHQVARLHVYAVDKSDVQRLLDDVALVQPSQSVMTDPQKRGMTLHVEQNPDGVSSQDKSKPLSPVIYMPTFWVDQSREEKVKKCPLLMSDDEYKNVEKNFRASLRNTKINIMTIERIQNPDLYTHYMIKKKQMENQNADMPGIPNERILWHGTDIKAIPSINHHGFNRSYCGKNATLFGEGVYFAIDSEYSAHPTYSPKDEAGKRYIYQCKVLTGQATKGEHGLKVLPSRSGVILYDSATNSLEKPTIYVIFNDNQAYPEYLITFTDKE